MHCIYKGVFAVYLKNQKSTMLKQETDNGVLSPFVSSYSYWIWIFLISKTSIALATLGWYCTTPALRGSSRGTKKKQIHPIPLSSVSSELSAKA